MIVGIDPSLTSTGVVVLDDTGAFLGAAQIPSGPGEALHRRLRKIARDVDMAICRADDDSLVVSVFMEEPGGALKGAAQDCRTLFWFIAEELCRGENVTLCSISPSTLTKFITGRGNATAQDKCAAVMSRWMYILPEEFHVSPEQKGGVGRLKDLFDGMGLAQAGLTHLTGEGTVVQIAALSGKVKRISP